MALRALDVSAQKRYVLFFPPFFCVVSRRGRFWQFRAAQGVDGVSEKLVGRPEGENVFFAESFTWGGRKVQLPHFLFCRPVCGPACARHIRRVLLPGEGDIY